MKAALSFALLLVGLLLAALWLLCSATTIRVEPPVKALGAETTVRGHYENPRGVRRLSAWVEQGGARHRMFEKTYPARRFLFWRLSEGPQAFALTAGTKKAPELKDGKARLVIEAQSNDFRGRVDAVSFDVEISKEPPRLAVDSAQHYINQGGAELVTFTVSGYWTEAGVRVGRHSFRSYPLPGKPDNERFSLFAFSWDTPANTVPLVYARHPTGAEVTGRFWFKVFPRKFRSRQLVLEDRFLEKVVNEIDPGSPGDLITRFLRINGEMRHQNNQALADLRLKSGEKFLWSGPFVQLTNSKVESQFADVRTYLYKGRKVDQQTHLGFDLSVVKKVDVVAANDGQVIHAGRLGIYGNTVVIDHGYGLQSIYAHLSRMDVKPGDAVKKRQPIGASGDTGLAGGDHLHFSMQVDGVQVNPVEWWDEHWIRDRILSKIPAAGAP